MNAFNLSAPRLGPTLLAAMMTVTLAVGTPALCHAGEPGPLPMESGSNGSSTPKAPMGNPSVAAPTTNIQQQSGTVYYVPSPAYVHYPGYWYAQSGYYQTYTYLPGPVYIPRHYYQVWTPGQAPAAHRQPSAHPVQPSPGYQSTVVTTDSPAIWVPQNW